MWQCHYGTKVTLRLCDCQYSTTVTVTVSIWYQRHCDTVTVSIWYRCQCHSVTVWYHWHCDFPSETAVIISHAVKLCHHHVHICVLTLLIELRELALSEKFCKCLQMVKPCNCLVKLRPSLCNRLALYPT